ncbi:hypothetical protein [Hwanghaeella sp. LZ110]|uniref:hypothetical protein n=1 Tax=Hwanghaeella sp. LZ110 TaxID=3402810 RepID=UPI003B67FA3E
MLPPVIELYVLWHPGDGEGENVANMLIEHFRGPCFSGVIGGGVQISTRSVGWTDDDSPPRPIYGRQNPAPNGIRPAEFIAVIPVLGLGLAEAVEDEKSEWHDYVQSIVDFQSADPDRFAIFPYSVSRQATNGTCLGKLVSRFQALAAGNVNRFGESRESALKRDLTQSLAQFLGNQKERLTVFISHTKHGSDKEGASVEALIDLTRDVLANTHLAEFFDASDLQPGEDWDKVLRTHAGKSSLLAIRSDLYASREWCQREVVIAKNSGMPVITIDAIGWGEERGSFLMDHVPRIPVRKLEDEWVVLDVVAALNLLTDECLKRAIWVHQRRLAEEEGGFRVAWWAPHAPELLTLIEWIDLNIEDLKRAKGDSLRILHPDPPLGPEELKILQKQAKLSALSCEIDIMTPRLLAARGG